MPHIFEEAPTGRAKCRGCNLPIQKGELRFGERFPNPFGEGEATLWFHPLCAAYKRPEPILESLTPEIPDRDALNQAAQASQAHRRLPRIDGAELSPSGKANCRQCRQPIERGSWRIRLVFYEEGRFSPGGFLHLACRGEYFEGNDILAPLLHFSQKLDEEQKKQLEAAFSAA